MLLLVGVWVMCEFTKRKLKKAKKRRDRLVVQGGVSGFKEGDKEREGSA